MAYTVSIDKVEELLLDFYCHMGQPGIDKSTDKFTMQEVAPDQSALASNIAKQT